MDKNVEREILHELRIIKRLLAQNLLSGDSQQKRISKLDSLGLQPTEIADTLGTTSNTVNVALSRLRKEKAKSAKG
jgi:DNA-directed RNA polymerase specialized sigma24 family protein